MTSQNILAFENLSLQLSRTFTHLVPTGRKWIKTQPFEKEWLQEAIIKDEIFVLPNVSAIRLEHKNKNSYIIIGNKLDLSIFSLGLIEECQMNSGLLTLLLAEKKLRLKKGILDLQFFDEIMYQHTESGYVGHDFQDFIPFLQDFVFFQIPDDSVLYKEDLYRILTYAFCKDKNNIVLELDDSILKFIEELSLMGSSKISYEMILNSILSTNFKHSFLELYRLVERLFPIHFLKELYGQIDTSMSFSNFTVALENVTSWKPKENVAIEQIFDNTKPDTKLTFQTLINSIPAIANSADHTFFYKLRNSIVHYRANHQENALNSKQWNELLFGTLNLIDQHYSQNSRWL